MTAGLVKSGLEQQINHGTAAQPIHGVGGDQTVPDVAALSSGDFIVAFQSINTDFGDQDIYAQQITTAGAYDDVQRDVAGFTPDQINPSVAATAGGGYVTAWQGFSHSIQLDVFNPAAGTFSTPLTLRDTSATPASYSDPTVATFANGNYALTYQSTLGSAQALEIAVINPGATALVKGTEVADNTFPSPAVATAGNTALIAWFTVGTGAGDSGLLEIQTREIDSAGSTLFSMQLTETPHSLGSLQVAGLADGRFAVVWADGTFGNLQGAIVDPASHTEIGVQFSTHADGSGPKMNDPHVAATPDGGLVVSWTETGFARDSNSDIFAQRFNSHGQAVGPDIQVNSLTTGNQFESSLAITGDGHVLVSWVDNNSSNPNSTDVNPGRIQGQLFALSPLPPPKNDFDNDAHGDILWHNDNGADSIWDDGRIDKAHIIATAGTVAASWHIVGKGDFDGNRHSDILWQNDNGAVSIWDNGAIDGAHIIANAGVVPSGWHIAGVGDFDGNGQSDILWRNDDGSVSIWDNGAIAGAHIVSGPGVVPADWHISGTGDFDGNGRDDILWRRDDGSVSIWDNGAIAGAHIVSGPGVVAAAWHISGTGDFDGNGRDDILWRHDDGSVSIWDNGAIAGAHIVSGPGVVAASWHISGTGDFDNNGQSDIVWRNDNGAASLWDNGDINHAHIIAAAGIVPDGWHIV